MDVSVRELRNHTARVVAAVESGEAVVLTVHGRPVADIVPHVARSERRSSEAFLRDLEGVRTIAAELSPEERPDPPRLDDFVLGFARPFPARQED